MLPKPFLEALFENLQRAVTAAVAEPWQDRLLDEFSIARNLIARPWILMIVAATEALRIVKTENTDLRWHETQVADQAIDDASRHNDGKAVGNDGCNGPCEKLQPSCPDHKGQGNRQVNRDRHEVKAESNRENVHVAKVFVEVDPSCDLVDAPQSLEDAWGPEHGESVRCSDEAANVRDALPLEHGIRLRDAELVEEYQDRPASETHPHALPAQYYCHIDQHSNQQPKTSCGVRVIRFSCHYTSRPQDES
mmetsp:Transcript_60939/g.170449  ORF Transcript_60939/g.170449 Transcript_60939/m.170449 type:complete len:250 (+) Transcript_60939:976-1725(+)